MTRLSDTQLVVLANAAKRDDGAIEPTPKLKEPSGEALIRSLMDKGFCTEVPRTGSLPLWKLSPGGAPLSLVISPRGLEAIGVDAKEAARPPLAVVKPKPQKAGRSKGATGAVRVGTASSDKSTKADVSDRRGAPARKSAAEPKSASSPAGVHKPLRSKTDGAASNTRSGSKLSRVIDMLRRPGGASLQAIMKETDWQAHSVRGAIAGAIKKKMRLKVVAETRGDERFYRIGV